MLRRLSPHARGLVFELSFYAAIVVFAWRYPVLYGELLLQVLAAVLTCLVVVLVVLLRLRRRERRARKVRQGSTSVVVPLRD